jgi:hypothetical protein
MSSNTTQPDPNAGPIGQQIGQQIGASGTITSSNWPFTSSSSSSTGTSPVSTSFSNSLLANYSLKTNPAIKLLSGVDKRKVRYVIVENDLSTLELKEQSTVTPEEMIGICKFISLVSTMTVVYMATTPDFNIKWSELIDSLNIRRHFTAGLSPSEYDSDDSDVLDILLFDSV